MRSVGWDTADLRKEGGFKTLAMTLVGGLEGVVKLYTLGRAFDNILTL